MRHRPGGGPLYVSGTSGQPGLLVLLSNGGEEGGVESVYRQLLQAQGGSVMGIVRLGNDWDQIIGGEFKRDYYRQLRRFLLEEYSTKTIYPDQWDIFAALRGTSYRDCKVVILGQDPYHGPRQAHGLAFRCSPGGCPALHH